MRSPQQGVSNGQRVSPRLPHLPALDGIRAVAVVAVFLLHAGFRQVPGGYLGVTVFFVLSGFLITALLLCEHEREGRVDLLAFWGRRVRRLAPAALLALGLIAIYIAFGADVPGDVLGDGIASLAWVANWRFVADGAAYADALESPSPFQHYWSLAVEEQLYLVLPVVVAALLALRGHVGRRLLAIVIVAGVGASCAAAALLHGPDDAPFRAYYGTDARVAEPLVGVLLALVLVRRDGLRRLSGTWLWVLEGAGVAAATGLAVLMLDLGLHDPRLYRGGFLLAALLAATVVAAATQGGTLVARALATGPLPALGRISYGVYLFHWPILLWLSEERTGLHPAAAAAVAAVITVTVAALSHELVELPIRQGRFPARVAVLGWMNATVGAVGVLAVAITLAPAQVPVLLGQDAGASPPTAPVTGRGSPTGAQPAGSEPGKAVSMSGGGAVSGASGSAPAAGTPPAMGSGSPGTVPGEAPPSPDAVRIAILGDSLGGNLGHGMEAWAEERDDVVVYNLAVNGCPISRGGKLRWPSRAPEDVRAACGWWTDTTSERAQKLRAFDPDVLVVEDGTNEIPDRYREEWGRWYRPGDPAFTGWLLDEYRAAARELAPAPVLLLDTPCADWEKYGNGWNDRVEVDGRVLAINDTVYRRDAFAGIVVESLFDQLCPNGVYQDEVEGVENGRPDGLHLHSEAALRLARRWLGPLSLQVAAGQRTPGGQDSAGGGDPGEAPFDDGVVPPGSVPDG